MSQSFTVAAPTRADLAGGTLDLWPLHCFTGGAKTINVALDLTANVRFDVKEDTLLKVEFTWGNDQKFLMYEPLKDDFSKVPALLKFPAFVVSRYLSGLKGKAVLHLKIHIETQAPLGSGLGGSSSLAVALRTGLERIFHPVQEQGWRWESLDWVRDTEAAFLNTPTGTQDYLAALWGGLRCYSYDLGFTTEKDYGADLLKQLNDRMVVIFSGEVHHSGKSNWEIFKSANEKDTNVLQGLKKIGQVAEQLDELFAAGNVDWKKVGRLMTEEWEIRKKVFGVQTKRLDDLTAFFLKSKGVLGCKVCGAAQGGSLIVLVEPDAKDKLIRSCEAESIQVLGTCATSKGVAIS